MPNANVFGDVRAEHDFKMLETAFFESQNYRTLFESHDRFIVVGRRGTGKSALTYKLSKDWAVRKNITIVIAPTEEQIIGVRPIAALFGDTFSRIRAGLKISWRYALMMEIASTCHNNYKTAAELQNNDLLYSSLKSWQKKGSSIFERLRATLKERLHGYTNAEDRIADLTSVLRANEIAEELNKLIGSLRKDIIILIDKLDEGYEPDTLGIGIVDGIIYGTDEIRNTFQERIRAIIFLRDNIFRAVQKEDKDFSRNLEGQVLRLHWHPEELFYMVCKRIRPAFGVEKESDVKVWNAITSNELHGREGFKRCLRFTLYRPRDVIALLNSAIEQAKHQDRSTLIEKDFKDSSKTISLTRFDDLGKEYESVFPGIRQITNCFANGKSKLLLSEAALQITNILTAENLDPIARQHFRILGSEEDIVKALYGVGFFGIYDKQNSTWTFSHDGKRPDKAMISGDTLMIHPCYWSALNLQAEELDQDSAEQIYDEYEITIHSQTTEQRNSNLGKIVSEISTLSIGSDGASQFENWCKQVIEIAFAKDLTNIQLRPNGSATQRRDIVATNQGLSGFWRRIREDYSTRQVVFEIKNYEEIGIEEYRQVNGYLTKEYGRIGFIICRDKQQGLVKGRELEAFREFYLQDKLIIKITANALISILSKLRSPNKIDAGDVALDHLLDTHIRLYSSGQSEAPRQRARGVRRPR